MHSWGGRSREGIPGRRPSLPREPQIVSTHGNHGSSARPGPQGRTSTERLPDELRSESWPWQQRPSRRASKNFPWLQGSGLVAGGRHFFGPTLRPSPVTQEPSAHQLPCRTVNPPGSFTPMERRPVELHVPLSGPRRVLRLMLPWFTFTFRPPGSAIVRLAAVRLVVRRVRVATRRRTVFVRLRFTAGRAGLRRRALDFFRVVAIAGFYRLLTHESGQRSNAKNAEDAKILEEAHRNRHIQLSPSRSLRSLRPLRPLRSTVVALHHRRAGPEIGGRLESSHALPARMWCD